MSQLETEKSYKKNINPYRKMAIEDDDEIQDLIINATIQVLDNEKPDIPL